jgi:micrococcal nuclease
MSDFNLFSHKIIMSVLAFVLAAGGYGGYQVVETYGKYGANFEKRLHLVEQVVDGDTLIIENDIRIRLLGIDAPESVVCFGEESKQQLAKLVLGNEILLEKDQTGSDNYDRLLRYVVLRSENPEVDDLFINNELVRKGFAQSAYIKPNRRYLAQLQASQREAEEEGVGMWSECEVEGTVTNPEREQTSDPFSEECVIKGNINKRYEKDYFLVGCPNYKRVKIDPRKGEKWFCTEKEAQADGWQKSAACNNIRQTSY